MFVLWPAGEASMAAGPVGIAGGVFGGRDLFVARSTLFIDNVDGFDAAAGFKLTCLCGKDLPSLPLAANDSQLSFPDGTRGGAAWTVDVELSVERNG